MTVEVTNRIVSDGPRRAIVQLMARGDANEIAALKVDPADFAGLNNGPCVGFSLIEAAYDVRGTTVRVQWEGVPSQDIFIANIQSKACYEDVGGLPNDAPGATGNILITTENSEMAWSYTVTLELWKKY